MLKKKKKKDSDKLHITEMLVHEKKPSGCYILFQDFLKEFVGDVK